METLSRSQIQVPRLPKDRYLKGVTLDTKFGADELNSVWPRSGSPGCQWDQIYPQSGPLGQVVGITFMKTLAVPLHCESCPLINSASHPKGKNTTRKTSSLIISLSFRICSGWLLYGRTFEVLFFSACHHTCKFLYWYHPFIQPPHPPMSLPYPPHAPINAPIYPLTSSTHLFIHPSDPVPFPPTPSTCSLIHPSIRPLIRLSTHLPIQFLSLHLRIEEVSFVRMHEKWFLLPLRLFLLVFTFLMVSEPFLF